MVSREGGRVDKRGPRVAAVHSMRRWQQIHCEASSSLQQSQPELRGW